MGKTEIVRCTCQSEFQDKKYGKGMRLYNVCGNGVDGKCTICGNKKRLYDRPMEKK